MAGAEKKGGVVRLPDGSGFFVGTVKAEGEPVPAAGTPEKKLLARWQSKSGKHWVELHDHGDGTYSYSAPGAGGVLGRLPSPEHAVSRMQAKVDSGYFLPDSARRPMERAKKAEPEGLAVANAPDRGVSGSDSAVSVGQGSDPGQMGGLGDLGLAEPKPEDPGTMPGHRAYHAYNKVHLDSDATDPEDPEFKPHVGAETEFGYARRHPVRLTPEQDRELLGHLHAMGHHLSRTYADGERASPDDLARADRLAAHHQGMAVRHFGEYRRKFKEFSGQPVSGYSPGSWDMLEEGQGGPQGEGHPLDAGLPRGVAKGQVPPGAHLDAAAHHMRHRDENLRHGTTWSGPAAKMHDVLYREHALAAGEDPDFPSALLQSKASMASFAGGARYPGHYVPHRWDDSGEE